MNWVVFCYVAIGIFAFVGRHPIDVTHIGLFWAMIVEWLGVAYVLTHKPTWKRRLVSVLQLFVVGSIALKPLGVEMLAMNAFMVTLFVGAYAVAERRRLLERLAPPPG